MWHGSESAAVQQESRVWLTINIAQVRLDSAVVADDGFV
jgi:hypothetical protein